MPAFVNVRVALVPVPSSNLPSSFRSQASVTVCPSGSDDVEVNVTGSPVLGDTGSTPNAAVGARLLIVTVWLIVAVPPSSSVTLSETVKVPGEPNERDAVVPVPSSNCPSLSRSHARAEIVPSGCQDASPARRPRTAACTIVGVHPANREPKA